MRLRQIGRQIRGTEEELVRNDSFPRQLGNDTENILAKEVWDNFSLWFCISCFLKMFHFFNPTNFTIDMKLILETVDDVVAQKGRFDL